MKSLGPRSGGIIKKAERLPTHTFYRRTWDCSALRLASLCNCDPKIIPAQRVDDREQQQVGETVKMAPKCLTFNL